jgi:putative ABC transport system ATP-binding protein
VMVTHDPHAARFASKVRHLEKGELLPEGQVPQDWMLTSVATQG